MEGEDECRGESCYVDEDAHEEVWNWNDVETRRPMWTKEGMPQTTRLVRHTHDVAADDDEKKEEEGEGEEERQDVPVDRLPETCDDDQTLIETFFTKAGKTVSTNPF